MTRRRFLKVSALGGLALFSGLLVGPHLPWGRYGLPSGFGGPLRTLSTKEYLILNAAARRILDGVSPAVYQSQSQPGGAGGTQGQGPDVALWIDGYLGHLDEALVNDVRGLLQVLEHSPLLLYEVSPFTALSPEAQDRVLLDWQGSRFAVRRQGLQALKSLCCLAYYQDPRSFAAIGYSGPMLP